MGLFEFITITRGLLWLLLSCIISLGLRDYGEKRRTRKPYIYTTLKYISWVVSVLSLISFVLVVVYVFN